ncbi:protein involved in ribonucleotide reduction [Ureibacillus xyleni]|uniref:Protein involved in ribonucleotide reduction n=1 Tax=Ureibacillus xyleni TaxID=614648 RepID=A0A285SCR6_9BACL|nr:class Ib ribonucleoside-diphosphate reductase assembly flavoprotein NrdI [Ureibacillus xyleni]SOC05545.1 protein involved in ribonucleotide reduction [Ureibacillus xyleni]
MIIYASRTGNVRYIVSKLIGETKEITEGLLLHQPFLLITYTDRLGEVPDIVTRFLEQNAQHCKGVVVSGNRNFGHVNFGAAGEKIELLYNIPLVRKLDLRGYPQDYKEIQQFYEKRVLNEIILETK